MDVCSFVCLFAWTDGWKFPPLFYRTLPPSGPLPKRVCLSVRKAACTPMGPFGRPQEDEISL